MGILALIVGIIAGSCTVMGIITAIGVLPPLGAELTVMFWLVPRRYARCVTCW